MTELSDAQRLDTYLHEKIAALENLRQHYELGSLGGAWVAGQLEGYRRMAAFIREWGLFQRREP